MCAGITRAGNAPALSREIAECRANVVQSIPPGTDPTNDYWRARADQLDRAAIACGLLESKEFEAWWAQEVDLSHSKTLRDCASAIHGIARDAFHKGLALGQEGRA